MRPTTLLAALAHVAAERIDIDGRAVRHLAAETEDQPGLDTAALGGLTDVMGDVLHTRDTANADCSASVHRSVLASDPTFSGRCQCEPGSFVVGDAVACQTENRLNQFDPEDLTGHGCLCEDAHHTMCGNHVRGAMLQAGGGAERCMCPSGGFLMGEGGRCNPAERTRTFNPAVFEGCQCGWNFGHLPDWSEHLRAFWGDLLQTDNPQGIEPKCQPYIEGSGERGLVLLMHGATSCSGWWYLVKDQLIADGWMVVATTHIGHGRKPRIDPGADWGITDYLHDMPIHGRGFVDYSNELSAAMQKYRSANPSKEMVLIGHSIGGAMATNMVIEEPNLWNKLLIMNPFFAPAAFPAFLDRGLSTAITSLIMPALDWGTESQKYRWSEGCDAIRLQGSGSGGMCQFGILNLRAWFQLGDMVQKKAESIGSERGVYSNFFSAAWNIGRSFFKSFLGGGGSTSSPLRAQLLAAINDGAVKNANIQFLERAFTGWALGGIDMCAFPEEFTHNFVCPIDFPWMDHWWLDHSRVEGGVTVIDHMANFARDGSWVPVRGVVAEGMGDDSIIGVDMCNVHQAR